MRCTTMQSLQSACRKHQHETRT